MNLSISKKSILFIFLAFAISGSTSAFAQSSPLGAIDDTGSPNFGVRKNGHSTKKPMGTPTPAPDAAFLRGVCNIVKSESLMIPGPCVNIVIVLNDSQGKEFERTRTNTQGAFEFSVENGKSYRFVSGSKLFDVVSPLGDVRGGSSISLKIREKNE
jgi:hypothetical protein